MRRDVIFLGALLAMISGEVTHARSPERVAMRVHCAGGALPDRDMAALCRQMVQSLAAVQPRALFRQVPEDMWQPLGPADVSIRLRMSETGGHLQWQVGPMGELQTGPDRPFNATFDASATALRHFTEDLVWATPPIQSALSAAMSR